MPDSPVAILPEASGGSSPDAPVVILGAAGGGGSPSPPVVILGAASGGGSPSSPVVILGAAGGGGSPSSPVAVLDEAVDNLVMTVTGAVTAGVNADYPQTGTLNGRAIFATDGLAVETARQNAGVIYWSGTFWAIKTWNLVLDPPAYYSGSTDDVATPDLAEFEAPANGSGIVEMTSTGGPDAPVAILGAATGGGSPSSPVTILAAAGAGGTPDKPAGVLMPTGGWPGRVLDDGEEVSDGPDGVLTDLGR